MTQTLTILPAECVGVADAPDGILNIGGLELPIIGDAVAVYVRRSAADLSIVEIAMARHDGLAVEESEAQWAEAERYALGPKEYWRSVMVGHWVRGDDEHIMTDEDFELEWQEISEEENE